MQPIIDSNLLEHLPKRIASNQFAVQRMDREQLRQAIEKPLALAGVRAEPGLVDTLLNEVGDEPGNLPLLEHALEQLWDKRAAGVISNAAYENIGRLKGSLRNYADQAYEALGDEKKRAMARKILTLHVRVSILLTIEERESFLFHAFSPLS